MQLRTQGPPPAPGPFALANSLYTCPPAAALPQTTCLPDVALPLTLLMVPRVEVEKQRIWAQDTGTERPGQRQGLQS